MYKRKGGYLHSRMGLNLLSDDKMKERMGWGKKKRRSRAEKKKKRKKNR
jgi:hypothetical protein